MALTRFRVQGGNLKSVCSRGKMPVLDEFHMDRNHLQCISSQWLPESPFLKILSFRRNKIIYVEKHSFDPYDMLKIIDLTYNRISLINLISFPSKVGLKAHLYNNMTCQSKVGLLKDLNHTELRRIPKQESRACEEFEKLQKQVSVTCQSCSGTASTSIVLIVLSIVPG